MKRTIFYVGRHEEKDGDKLTPKGRERALGKGRAIDGELLEVYHSPKNRARETAECHFEGRYGIVKPELIKEDRPSADDRPTNTCGYGYQDTSRRDNRILVQE